MANKNLIKVLGLIATVIGVGATLITDWVNEQKMDEMMDEKIEEKVNEVFTKKNEDENNEEES